MNGTGLTQSHWLTDTSQPLLDCTLSELLRQVAGECPDQIALVDIPEDGSARKRWTYAQLLGEVETYARALMARFEPGDTVGIYAPNSADWVIVQHALAMAGLILVPINPAYEKAELALIVSSAGLSGMFYAENFRGRALGDVVDEAMAECGQACTKISLKNWRETLGSGDREISFPKIDPANTLLIQYTSGTTGVPKGACLHHRGTINMGRFVGERADFPSGGVWINAMPLYHVGGAIVTAFATLNGRGSYVVAPGFDPGQMLELIESEKGNCTLVVPTMIHALMTHPEFSSRDLSSMVTVLTGAAPVPDALGREVKDRFDCQLSILFGQTELNGVISQTGVHDAIEDQCGTLGQPLPQVEVRIVDPDSGATVAIDQPGEIWARGYQVMNSYHGMEDATRETITSDGWLRTGDIGTMDSRGYLRIVGRLKDMIIRGGMNLYPREIEDVLFQHPQVAQVSVIGIPDDHWGEVVTAVIMPSNGDNPPDPAELHSHCRDHLAAHKAPQHWFFVESYPLTPSGKIQKFELIESIKCGELREVEWEKG